MPSWIDCWTSSYLRVDVVVVLRLRRVARELDRRLEGGADLGRQRQLGQHRRRDPPRRLIAIGNIFSRATLSSCSAFASRRPRASTGIESGPPTVAIGTIGTPARIAIRMKPLRPASTASSRSVHGRSESISPPGHSATSWPLPARKRSSPARPAARPSGGSRSRSAATPSARRARCRAAGGRCRSAATTGCRPSTRPTRTARRSGCRSAARAARAGAPSPRSPSGTSSPSAGSRGTSGGP